MYKYSSNFEFLLMQTGWCVLTVSVSGGSPVSGQSSRLRLLSVSAEWLTVSGGGGRPRVRARLVR